MRIGYLGPPGTFSEEAALTAPEAAGAELVGLPSIHAAVMAVQDGTVDRAVVPIENALEGPVGITLDTLAGEALQTRIVGEVVVPVRQHLVAGGPLALADVERVISHPQATAQCRRYLRERLPDAEVAAASSTADAAREVATAGRPWAALSTLRAARLYGATILAEGVQDEPGNATRFVWLAADGAANSASADAQKTGSASADAQKTSLAFWGAGDDSPGWLVRCLSEFAFRGVNLTKIESRPLRGRLGHYRFFVDCEGGEQDDAVAGAITGLHAHCEAVRVLGSYALADRGLGL